MEIGELVDSLSRELVEDYAMVSGEDTYQRGQELSERVSMVSWNPRRGVLSGSVTSQRGVRQKVKVSTRGGLDGTCTCATASDCEHAVALLLHLLEESDRYLENAPEPPPVQRPSRPVRPAPVQPPRTTTKPVPEDLPDPPSKPERNAGASVDELVAALVEELANPGNVQRIGVLLTQLEHHPDVGVSVLVPLVRVAHLGSTRRKALPGVAARVNGLVSRCTKDRGLPEAADAYLGVVTEGGAKVEAGLWVGMSDKLRQEVLDVLHEARRTLPVAEVGPVQEVLEARAQRDSRSSELLRLLESDPRGGRDQAIRSLRSKVILSAARYSNIVS